MGVFNVSSVNEDFDFTPSELNYDEVNVDNIMMGENFAQMAIMDASEYIQEHSDLIRSMGGQEISITESGQEVIYEASTLSGIGEKIKGILKKFIAKIKELLSKVVAVFSSWLKSDKDFIDKYSKTLTQNWVKVKKLKVKAYKYDAEVKGFSFSKFAGNATGMTTVYGTTVDGLSEIDSAIKGQVKQTVGQTITGGSSGNAKTIVAALNKINMEAVHAGVRHSVGCAVLGKSSSDTTVPGDATTKEFSDALYEYWRGGEEAKEEMDKSELESNGYSLTNILTVLQGGEKLRKNGEKKFHDMEKDINKFIKDNIDKALTNATKDIASKTADEQEIATATAAVLTFRSAFSSTYAESYHTAYGIYLQLCKEYSRTCKSIATKVVAMGEKRLAQEESYDFGNDDDGYNTSYMNAVVIK